jgi:hypothetical protein
MTQLRDLILEHAGNYDLNDYSAIAAWFNFAPLIPNPATQGDVQDALVGYVPEDAE